MSIGRIVLSSLAGAAAGGFGGAALLGVPSYFSNQVGFLGPERNLAWLVAVVGFVFGIVPGTVVGLLVGLRNPHPFGGAIIGVAVGFLVLIVLFASGMHPELDTSLYLIGVAWLPISGVIGLIIALINYRPPPVPDRPLDRDDGRIFSNLTD